MVHLPTQFLTHCFISGLRPDIKHSVLVHKPATLSEAMHLAQLHEQRIQLERGVLKPSLGGSKPLLPTPKQSPGTSVFSPSIPTATATLPGGNRVPFRHLAPTEATHRCSQGLCYHCDEKYEWGHKCKAKSHLLLLEEEFEPPDALAPELLSPSSPAVPDSTSPDTTLQLHSSISYNALAGGCSSSTLRFEGTVRGKQVQVLLDGGSTHNFVQTRMAKYLNLPITTSPGFSVLALSNKYH
ncbi:hypothetical protein ES288_D08G174900v1 [Gossypium darwinii]|uniref:Retrotransposon gag domain-containing protein n=2 Tax=Gossypium TaxID=3633 RepID=A0A5D2JV41_GOSTO|nr:hypothetical protein ES288_D08G174900v1 [Gossypium darwinii]TYH58671.1 hypothetical protein ES332_D08G171200v1 [Gossypium tomentosum]